MKDVELKKLKQASLRETGCRVMRTVKIVGSGDGIKPIQRASVYKVKNSMVWIQGQACTTPCAFQKGSALLRYVQKVILPLEGTAHSLLQALQV
jgi:hypothetical protein